MCKNETSNGMFLFRFSIEMINGVKKFVKQWLFTPGNRTLIHALFVEPGFFYNLEKPIFL